MSSLCKRVVKLEEYHRRRMRSEPYFFTSADGRVVAEVTPLPDGPPRVVARFDIALSEEEREAAIAALPLPSPYSLYSFPTIVESFEEWQEAFLQYQQRGEPKQEN